VDSPRRKRIVAGGRRANRNESAIRREHIAKASNLVMRWPGESSDV
jgi:hypothetical protein